MLVRPRDSAGKITEKNQLPDSLPAFSAPHVWTSSRARLHSRNGVTRASTKLLHTALLVEPQSSPARHPFFVQQWDVRGRRLDKHAARCRAPDRDAASGPGSGTGAALAVVLPARARTRQLVAGLHAHAHGLGAHAAMPLEPVRLLGRRRSRARALGSRDRTCVPPQRVDQAPWEGGPLLVDSRRARDVSVLPPAPCARLGAARFVGRASCGPETGCCFESTRNAQRHAAAEPYHRVMDPGVVPSRDLRGAHRSPILLRWLRLHGPSAKALLWARASPAEGATATGAEWALEMPERDGPPNAPPGGS